MFSYTNKLYYIYACLCGNFKVYLSISKPTNPKKTQIKNIFWILSVMWKYVPDHESRNSISIILRTECWMSRIMKNVCASVQHSSKQYQELQQPESRLSFFFDFPPLVLGIYVSRLGGAFLFLWIGITGFILWFVRWTKWCLEPTQIGGNRNDRSALVMERHMCTVNLDFYSLGLSGSSVMRSRFF